MRILDTCTIPAEPVTLTDGTIMTIRLLAENDGDAYVAFYGSIPAQDNRYYIGAEACTPEKARQRGQCAHSATELCLVLEGSDGKIYGEAWYRWKSEKDHASVFGICMSQDIQGSGAGGKIMNSLMALSAHHGPPIMSLTVQKENKRAVHLYEKIGFVVIKEQIRPARADCEALEEYYMERVCYSLTAQEAKPCKDN